MPAERSLEKQALLAIKQLRAKLDRVERARREPIAVIGAACRLPKAGRLDEYWLLLRDGLSGVGAIPADRSELKALYDPTPATPGRMYLRQANFVEDALSFDAAFFNIRPPEAAEMDPQQRVLLEVAWQALESAGLDPLGLAGSRTGVFLGITAVTNLARRDVNDMGPFAITGIDVNIAAGRIAYLLDLRGPAESVDTACSSSLVALHQACASLRLGECDMAVVGGVSMVDGGSRLVALSQMSALAADGQCKTFDARADGFGVGEGCGVVVLRRQSDAQASHHQVLATIMGSALNQDGRSQGLTAPSGLAQQAVVRDALAFANLTANEIDHIEAHGTGTSLGDPIEVEALNSVFERDPGQRRLPVGSAKANIGHLSAGAGIAGLIKLMMSLRNQEIPPHLQLRDTNPLIELGHMPFVFGTERRPWPAMGRPRRGSISSFGFSGTNAHVVVQDAVPTEPEPAAPSPPGPHVFAFSARSHRSLRTYAARFAAHLAEYPSQNLATVCAAVLASRTRLRCRAAVVSENVAALRHDLLALARGETSTRIQTAELAEGAAEPKLAFLLDALAPHSEVAELARTEPVFRAALEQYQPLPSEPAPAADAARLAPQFALAQLLASWGVKATAVVGHGACRPEELSDPGYWRRLAATRPEIASAAQVLAALKCDVVVALGCGQMLPLIRNALGSEKITYISSWRGQRSPRAQLLEAVSALYLRGAPITWQAVGAAAPSQALTLPGQPFEHAPVHATDDTARHPFLGERETRADGGVVFETHVAPDQPHWLHDHTVHEWVVLPAVAYLEMAAAGAHQLYGEPCGLEEVAIERPLVVPPLGRRVRLSFTPEGHEVSTFEIASRPADTTDPWTVHGRGTVRYGAAAANAMPSQGAGLRELRAELDEAEAGSLHYELLAGRGLFLGPCFQGVQRTWRGKKRPGQALGEIETPPKLADLSHYRLHPALLDACIQVQAFDDRVPAQELRDTNFLPVAIERAVVKSFSGGKLWSHMAVRDVVGQDTIIADCGIYDDQGDVVAKIDGLKVRRAPREALLRIMRAEADTLSYELSWEPSALPERPRPTPTGPWVVFADRHGFGEQVASHLRARGEHCHLMGESSAAKSRDDFIRLLRAAAAEGGAPWRGVIYLWGLDSQPEVETSPRSLVADAAHGLGGLLYLVQAMASLTPEPGCRLVVATDRAQPLGDDKAAPSSGVIQPALWGLARVVEAEHPELGCTRIDLDASDPGGAALLLVRELTAEGDEREVGLRAAGRYVARLVRRQAIPPEKPLQLRSDGTYFLVGGLGGLGMKLALWMASRGAGALAFLSRHAPGAATCALIDKLRATGATVRIIEGDAGEKDDVARALAEIARELPPLAGVVHAAGTLADGVLSQQSWPKFEAVWRGKALGAWNLHQLTKKLPLDFFVLYSSIASVLGTKAQGNYAAANAFLDGLAWRRHGAGLKAVSINWGPWDEVGMAAQVSAAPARGFTKLKPARGLDSLESILHSPSPQWMVAAIDWRAYLASSTLGSDIPPFFSRLVSAPAAAAAAPAAAPASSLMQNLAQTPPAERERVLADFIRREVVRILGGEAAGALSPHQKLTDVGLDSLMALELRNRLGAGLGRGLPATVVFEHPTVEALAGHLASQIAPSVGRAPTSRPAAKPPSHAPAAPRFESLPAVADDAGADTAIAIVGMACRLPQSSDPEQFWRLLRNGAHAFRPVPKGRWPQTGKKLGAARFGAFIDRVDGFAPSWLSLPAEQLAGVDPQHKLLLQVSFEALEQAGINPTALAGSMTGVFVGCFSRDFQLERARSTGKDEPADWDLLSGHSVGASLISRAFDLLGPSESVEAASASALLALCRGCQSLTDGEADLVIAGGVDLALSADHALLLERDGKAAQDGVCRSFDAGATGTVRGEGCGVVVLKKLSAAQRAGDPVLAVIRGFAVTHSGRGGALGALTEVGLATLFGKAAARARVQPSELAYIEAQAMGLPAGDAIELLALGSVLRQDGLPAPRVATGSVHTNVGHLFGASGIAGLLKVVLALRHAEIPPHLNLREVHPASALEDLPVVISTERRPLRGAPLAAVNSFGAGGTNVQVIVGAPPRPSGSTPSPARGPHLFLLSAPDDDSLRALSLRYSRFFAEQVTVPVAAVCYTAATARAHLARRLAMVVHDPEALGSRLEAAARGHLDDDTYGSRAGRGAPAAPVLFFDSLPAQPDAAWRQVYDRWPAFRERFDECAELLAPKVGKGVSRLLDAPAEAAPQNVVFAFGLAVELALAHLWLKLGVAPRAVLGQGPGEHLAACVAGTRSVNEALALATSGESPEPSFAARLQAAVPAGRAVLLRLGSGVSAASLNKKQNHESVVWVACAPKTAGGGAVIEEVAAQLYALGVDLDWEAFYAGRPHRRQALPNHVQAWTTAKAK